MQNGGAGRAYYLGAENVDTCIKTMATGLSWLKPVQNI